MDEHNNIRKEISYAESQRTPGYENKNQKTGTT